MRRAREKLSNWTRWTDDEGREWSGSEEEYDSDEDDAPRSSATFEWSTTRKMRVEMRMTKKN